MWLNQLGDCRPARHNGGASNATARRCLPPAARLASVRWPNCPPAAHTAPCAPSPLPPCSTESDVKHAHREIMNHQRLLHPHVVQLKEVFAVKPYLALVMEYVPNGDMFQVGVPPAGCRLLGAALVPVFVQQCHWKLVGCACCLCWWKGCGGIRQRGNRMPSSRRPLPLPGATLPTAATPACPHAPTYPRPCPALQYVVSRRGLPESEARWFFQQLMLGMDYCHRKGGSAYRRQQGEAGGVPALGCHGAAGLESGLACQAAGPAGIARPPTDPRTPPLPACLQA